MKLSFLGTSMVLALCIRATAIQAQTPLMPAAQWAEQIFGVKAVISGEARWAPDGSKLLYVSSQGGSTGLWSISPQGGTPAPLAAGIGGVPSTVSFHARWSPRGDYVAYISNRGGRPAPADVAGPVDLWLWSARDGKDIKLTDLGARIGQIAWSPDGRWIAYTSTLNGSMDVWKVAVPTGERYRLTNDRLHEISPAWSPDGQKLYYVLVDSHWIDHDIVEISADGQGRRVVTRDRDFFDYGTDGATPNFGTLLVSPDGRRLGFRSWRSGWINYWTVPVAGGEPTPLAAARFDQSDAVWAPDGKSIAYLENHNGTSELRVATITAAGVAAPARVVFAPASGVLAGLQWSPDSRSLSFNWGTPTRPADLFVVAAEGAASAPRRLTTAAVPPGLDSMLVMPEKVTYRSDSLTINAYLYKPRTLRPGQRAPALVFAHGGPTGQYRDAFDVQMQFFLGQGYVVLAPNFRGGSGYGRAFADLNNKCWAHCDLDDLVAGAAYLRGQPYVSSAVGITGRSHGGLLAMGGATFAKGAFQAATAIGGTADRIFYYNTQLIHHIKQAENEFGPLKGNEETYRYVSPQYWVDQVDTPIFVLWGEGRYPGSENSSRYVAELERQYKTYRAKAYQGEDYYVFGAKEKEMVLDMLDFYQQHLRVPATSAPVP